LKVLVAVGLLLEQTPAKQKNEQQSPSTGELIAGAEQGLGTQFMYMCMRGRKV